MAVGFVRKRNTAGGVRWDAKIDTAPPGDPRMIVGKTFTTKREAQSWLTRTRGELATGSYVSPAGLKAARVAAHEAAAAAAVAAQAAAAQALPVDLDTAVPAWTVETWCRHVLATDTKRRANTREQYLRGLEVHVFPGVGTVALTELRAAQLEAHYRTTTSRAVKPAGRVAVARAHAALSACLQTAARKGEVAVNVARITDLPQAQETARKVPWTLEQALTFLAHVDNPDAPHPLRAAFRLLLATGLRRSELLGLRWHAVDLDPPLVRNGWKPSLRVAETVTMRISGSLRIEQDTKSARSNRTITLDADTAQCLREHRDRQQAGYALRGAASAWTTDGHLFTDPSGKLLRPDYFGRELVKVGAAAGVPALPPHALRHVHATFLLEAGMQIGAVSDRLGHSSVQLTQDLYRHTLQSRADTLADSIGGILATAPHAP